MNLQPFLHELNRLPAWREMSAALEAGETLPPQSLLPAARPYLVAALREARSTPIVVLTARSEMAQQFADHLRHWLPPVEEGGAPILHFSDPDALPYERIHWSSANRQRRLTALAALQSKSGSPPIVIASARALMQRTLPAKELRLSLRPVKVGQQLRLEQVTLQWAQSGYNPADVVEEPGSFARRGGIVDIWPPNLPQPVRIDLFGDEVESLRIFDPASQRTIRKVNAIEIGPGSEALSKFGEAALERLGIDTGSITSPEAMALGSAGSPLLDPTLLLAVREEIRLEVNAMALGHAFHGIEWYLPYFYAQPASLLDHMPAEATLIVDDALDLFGTLNELETQAASLRLELSHSGESPANFAASHFTTEELRTQIGARKPLLLGYGDLTGKAANANTPLARAFAPGPRYGGRTKQIASDVVKLRAAGESAVIVTRQASRIQELLVEQNLVVQVQGELGKVNPPIALLQGVMSEGFVLKGLDATAETPSMAIHLLTDGELFGWSRPQARGRTQAHSRVAPELFFADVKVGDFVVHIEHGIGQFDGLVHVKVGETEREYLQVSYARGDKLYVPVHQADRLSRYVGAGERTPPVNRLGTADWQLTKEKARKAIAEIADDLLKLYAERELVQGHVYSPDGPWQEEMEAAFPYEETEDQLHAIEAVKRDMESDRPMDRLICGDVGYGKTEVALRAAFKAITDGKQVVMLVPTTVLALQHYRNTTRRFERFPVRVEMLSRFRTPAQQARIMEGVREGSVDMVIGTHRLLGQDIVFKDLGLLIIDEEQRFGVTQKEKLKVLRTQVDVITLSATPIPRTLHMSLSGLRDMSTINTPPRERQPIATMLSEWDDTMVRQAIQREIARKGQVFVVHDKVRGIQHLADRIRHLVPEASIVVGHGQMDEHELEEVMMRFADGDFDVLVATTIIENGLDIPNANTIVINRADHFGLAQLYQLRGRVGRSAQRGHCYLLYDKHQELSFDARRRLSAILESSEELGAGFRIAMRDLEIRGAGELLGAKQSGNIDSVGFDLYTRLVAQAINDARAKKERFERALRLQGADAAGNTDTTSQLRARADAAASDALQQAAKAMGEEPQAARPESQELVLEPDDDEVTTQNGALHTDYDTAFDVSDPLAPPVTLDLPLDARIPPTYVEDEGLRLQLYRRIAGMTQDASIEEMRRELVDRFGEDMETHSVPEEVENLFYQIRIKTLAVRAGVERIGRENEQIVLHAQALENMDRKTLERRLRLGLGKVSEDTGLFLPHDAAWVGRRAIYLPIDEAERWRTVLLRTLEIMAVA